MIELFTNWYKRRFSDPHVAALMLSLITSIIILYFLGQLLAPLIIAVILAYFLDWPVNYLERKGMRRFIAIFLVLLSFIGITFFTLISLIPNIWRQISSLMGDVPRMYEVSQVYLTTLPAKYPQLMDLNIVEKFISNLKDHVLMLGEHIVKGSLASLGSIATLLVYLIVVPLLLIFLLKDKDQMITMAKNCLPTNRRLVAQVCREMNQQIMNYIRGKLIEILVVGLASYILFIFFGLSYPLLMAVLVGLSVLIPYVGAIAVTIPIALIGVFQWGFSSTLYWLLLVHFIVQALDGNILVPLLFSEAVNLHPIFIILSVLVFGGLWGFWGAFFAIPLATLVKAVFHALSKTTHAV